MKKWGFSLEPTDVDGAHQALSMALPLDTDFHPSVEALVAPDEHCAVCGSGDQRDACTLETYTHARRP